MQCADKIFLRKREMTNCSMKFRLRVQIRQCSFSCLSSKKCNPFTKLTSIRNVSSSHVTGGYKKKKVARFPWHATSHNFDGTSLIGPLSLHYCQQRVRSLLSVASLFSLLHIKAWLGLAGGHHHGNYFYELSETHVCTNDNLRFFTNLFGIPKELPIRVSSY